MITLAKLLQHLCNKMVRCNWNLLVTKLQFNQLDKVLDKFEYQLRDFIQLFDMLNKTGLGSNLYDLSKTHFVQPPKDTMERDFLGCAITAHLQTHCCSVVLGDDMEEVNKWVNTLAQFLLPSEKLLCRHAHK